MLGDLVRIGKLEVAGFKSFENKNTLHFKQGITAIVGPNGSGKSNIADAIRWVMGEQKPSRLRVAKSEDVIFHGTNNSRQASMAQVTITLKDDKEADDIVISRKLYRSGESELKLNGKKVKYSIVEELLAQNGFGTQTYTVVAQGMIDKILTSTGQERKMLFDEASGVRQYDIRRVEAYRRLKSAITNLDSVNSIISELSPAVSILKKQTEAQSRSEEIKKKLSIAQKSYLKLHHDNLMDSQKKIVEQIKANSQELVVVNKKLQYLKTISNNETAKNRAKDSQTDNLKSLETRSDELTKQLYESKNQLDQLTLSKNSIQPKIKEEISIEKELEKLVDIDNKLNQQILDSNDEIKKLQGLIDELTDSLSGLNKNLDFLQLQISKSQKKEYILHASSLAKEARVQLRQTKSRKTIDETILKITKILDLAEQDDAAEMALSFSKLQNTIGRAMSRREEIIEKQTKDIIRLRSLELDLAANKSSQESLQKILSKLNTQTKELSSIDSRIKDTHEKIDSIKKESKILNSEIEALRKDLYQSNQHLDQKLKDSSEIENLTSSKTRLEITINQLNKELEQSKLDLIHIDSKAKHWGIDSYKQYKDAHVKPYTLHEIEDLSVELRAIEEMDPDIINEAKESTKRIEFLKLQQLDLQKAVQDTNKLIDSLQADMKKQFEKSFKKINLSFDKYFKTLFRGGSASLEMESSEEDFGIEIKVSPPGKRSRNINTLSGGEKALAAIALLSSIIANNPSPFIVLDEVDAALDDENSMRFTKVLAELANHSQVILITHNQETMQTANSLFGITSSKNKSTEILGLDLVKAKEYTLTS